MKAKDMFPKFQAKFGTELGTTFTRKDEDALLKELGLINDSDQNAVKTKARSALRRGLSFYMTRQLKLNRWLKHDQKNETTTIITAPREEELSKQFIQKAASFVQTRAGRNVGNTNAMDEVFGKDCLTIGVLRYDAMVEEIVDLRKENKELKLENTAHKAKLKAIRDAHRLVNQQFRQSKELKVVK